MVNARQEREIKELMASIKEAKNEGAGNEEIKRRTAKLYQYLEKEGIINPFDG